MTQDPSPTGTAEDLLRLEKLKHLRLPTLVGKRFLDVACQDGFFCGYAAFAGAQHALGLDRSAADVRLARKRFPHCEFVRGGWDRLPKGRFDVILLASNLLQGEDPTALVRSLV